MLLMACDNFYRGIGRTDVPMWFGFVKLFLNSGANYVFIFGHLGAHCVGLVGRDGHRGENADNRDHDHQLDQRETLLLSHSGTPMAPLNATPAR